ncbi:MAG: Single-stranded DNA-binding protein [Candidatus Magnetoglobus multicellularis str. Araruama]|uniref:Single-stranded DNA-binding protein n=1 Tax=Candidatus Magnetoglobus multicellularis str. Araruama TaxID=890399 RepID=A0A1V1PDS8_9BACT|nr:MAG: Single-stranded DNA-binding protein [Candidatus Magnetoglobus multicellularis str. Araruama]
MFNQINLIGYLGKDPELKSTNDGSTITIFNMATSEKWQKNGETKEKTEWHRCVCFGALADTCGKWLKKGSLVFVSGKVQTRSYQTQSGETRYTTEVICQKVSFLDRKEKTGGHRNSDTYGNNVPF